LSARERLLVREHNDRAWLAWHVASLGRVKKMPPLRELLQKRAAPRKSWQEQLDALKSWVVASGGRIEHQKRDQ
jgi:hypothetical protein